MLCKCALVKNSLVPQTTGRYLTNKRHFDPPRRYLSVSHPMLDEDGKTSSQLVHYIYKQSIGETGIYAGDLEYEYSTAALATKGMRMMIEKGS